MKTVNWAIIAPGGIAQKFATALQGTERAHLYSVAGRSKQRATEFAKQYEVETVADDIHALVADPNVDVVYIASPHVAHAEQSIIALNAGKAVLCEKPMTVNRHQASSVIQAAKDNKTFYMEAVWTRFMPFYSKIREWLEQGQIGAVQTIQANFGFAFGYDAKHRLFNPELAGGSLLDLGIYPITLAQMVTQQNPENIVALAEMGRTDVDENLGMILRYPNGEIAILSSNTRANTLNEAIIYGTKGRITIPMFWCAESAILSHNTERDVTKVEQFSSPHKINGYEGEIEEVHRCLDQGLLESPTLPWSESLQIIEIMDEVRNQIGLRYPFEG